jgi:hypothetical protein
MAKVAGFAVGALFLMLHAGRASVLEPGSMPIPIAAADLAAAAGLTREDPATLPLDIVRMAFAAPEAPGAPADGRLAAIRKALDGFGSAGRLPLPLAPATWRAHVLHADVADSRLAFAIFAARPAALLYHGLLALDPPTLSWLEASPDVLDTWSKHPGTAAAFARSIHVRDGAVVTPGADADAVWRGIVGVDPGDAAAFASRLMTMRAGRVAAFYDGVAHLDAAHQRFVIGAPGEANRVDRARGVVEAVMRGMSPWRLEEYPFIRADLDAPLDFRQVALDARGVPLGPPQRAWAKAFNGAPEADAPVDAGWLVDHVLRAGGSASRRRFEAFRFAQRVLPSEGPAQLPLVADALRDFLRAPALMLTLESAGVRGAPIYAAAGKAATALGADAEALTLFQGGVSLVERARTAGTIDAAETQRAIGSLMNAAVTRTPRAALLKWLRADLFPSLKSRLATAAGQIDEQEEIALRAIAGPAPAAPVVVEWEGQRYAVDLSQPELRRLKLLRRSQQEPPLGGVLASATPRNLAALSDSLAALVYAVAMGPPDSQAAGGGAVWRRHRFGAGMTAPGESQVPWRSAVEVFGRGEWHLTGSMLRLDVVLAHLALRRLDPTEMPERSLLSTMDRRTLARTVVLINGRTLTDDARDKVAAALAGGRARVASLLASQAGADAIGADAGLSEWRSAALRWRLAHDASRIATSFTALELFRLGGGVDLGPGWGAAAETLDGCVCLRMPEPAPWEEYTGRASSGQLATGLADVMLRSAEALAARRLPAILTGAVAAFAMQDTMDAGRPQYFDDWLSLAFAARDLSDDRFDDYVAALTAAGPLVPLPRTGSR